MNRIGKKSVVVLAVALLCLSMATTLSANTGELVIVKNRDAITLDPHNVTDIPSEEISRAIYQGLVTFDKDLNVIPMLASEWTHSDDGREWTFTLREGIRFHSGTPFDAQAVKVNFDRILQGGYERTSLYGPIMEAVEVLDDYRVKFVLKESYGPFLNVMAHTAGLIVDPSYVTDEDKNAQMKDSPSGTGPFVLERWEKGETVSLKANKDYWQGEPKLERVIFRTVKKDGDRSKMLEAGEADIAHQIPPTDVERLLKNRKIDMRILPSVIVQFIAVNCQDDILKDPAVRQALAYSIDRQAICDKILKGHAEPIDSMIAPSVRGHNESQGFTYDPEKARAILKEAGWVDTDKDGIREKEGKKLSVEFWTHGRDTFSLEVPQSIQAFANAVGFDCQVRTMEWDELLSSTAKGLEENRSQLMWIGWSPSTGDADWVYRPLVHTESWPPKGENRAFYSNKAVDEAIMTGFRSVDQEEREAAYKKAQEILSVELPWIPLYNRKTLHGFNTKVKSVDYLPLDFILVTHESHKED